MKNIINVGQFSKEELLQICDAADYYKTNQSKILIDKTVTCLFYQPSTRTFVSFIAAAQNLGANVIPIQGVEYSSVAKGESFEDTIKTLSLYSDCIVLRHPEVGAAQRAAEVSEVPIINAGDGIGEHPTQALLDLYTIRTEKKQIDGLHVAFVGDIKHSRTIHSLAKVLSLYDVKMSFVGPEELSCEKFMSEFPNSEYHEDIGAVIDKADVIYMTRVQKEYHEPNVGMKLDTFGRTKTYDYKITKELMVKAKSNMILMHPLPRLQEIPVELDKDPRSVYFKQVKNGLFVREALLVKVLGKDNE